MAKESLGVIRADEAYSKHELLNRLGISQRFWDQMLDEGLPFCSIGHARWVRGADVIEYMQRNSERRQKTPPAPSPDGLSRLQQADEAEHHAPLQ
jgi:hypothetical protein